METKELRIATLGITEEFRNMGVGETVRFPLSRYKYSTIRATPSTSLVNERIEEGRSWKTQINYDEKCVDVIRIA
ncbi:hypothetical protein ED388_04520 [Muribaculaceae bacterium Isolate-007 (NCI)]|nr:hypothetical protein EEL42_03245 [Muribaculaceae bacterium Isolate-100 (HZI)]RXE66251.1 hypothetical protein ED388_04520 [Muribaculaceae bacterium Isolate-007 (NCI)]